MVIHRKQTLPNHLFDNNRSSETTITKQQRLKSQMREIQMTSPYFEQTQKFIKSSKLFEKFRRPKSSKRMKSFQLEDLGKIILQNRLTLDFRDSTRCCQLPEISTFKMTHKQLISSPIFQQFKQANKINGRYPSALSEAQKELNSKKKTMKISKGSLIIVRQNFLSLGKSSRQLNSLHSFGTLSVNERKRLSSELFTSKNIRKNDLSLHRVSNKSKLQNNDSIDKWKLKDFFDPITQELQNNEQSQNKQRHRQAILYKLKKIDAECSAMSSNTQATHKIEVFAKYSKNMSQKLAKKQKRIDKVNYFSF